MLVTIDTGGTKTLVAAFDKDGKLGKAIRFPTPVNPDEYIALLRRTIRRQYKDKPVEAITVALPGIIKDGVALWCNNLGWKDFHVRKALEGVLEDVPVLIENDANLAGLAETRMLRHVPVSSLYVTVSTGIGTGVITHGHIDPGLRHSEGGRMLVEYDGTVREWESFASGRAVHATYQKFARDITDKHTWDEIAERISRGFLAVIPLIQPDVIIIGGSIGTYFDRYSATLSRLLKQHLPPYIVCPRLTQAKHPEEAVIYGCYYYALDYLAST